MDRPSASALASSYDHVDHPRPPNFVRVLLGARVTFVVYENIAWPLKRCYETREQSVVHL